MDDGGSGFLESLTTAVAAEDINLAQILEAGTSSLVQGDPIDTHDLDTPIEDKLDNSMIEILGDDLSTAVEFGKEIYKELANRFEHITTTGLTKEARKELCDKYLVSANCKRTGALKLNAEVKAAMNETLIKRDKAIEARQQQLASAVSCLAQIASDHVTSKEINHNILKKIMDAGRLLCDFQNSESITRRNFAVFSLKKEMKDHLLNTSIDKFLFSENLPETLKTAKAVTKSGTDSKADTKISPRPRTTQKQQPPRNLNWKPPVPQRRQPGPPRSREPAARRSQFETSSKPSPRQQRPTRRH